MISVLQCGHTGNGASEAELPKAFLVWDHRTIDGQTVNMFTILVFDVWGLATGTKSYPLARICLADYSQGLM